MKIVPMPEPVPTPKLTGLVHLRVTVNGRIWQTPLIPAEEADALAAAYGQAFYRDHSPDGRPFIIYYAGDFHGLPSVFDQNSIHTVETSG